MSVAEALRARDPSRLPSRRDEGWRWTDLRGLIRELPPASPEAHAGPTTGGPWEAIAADEVLIVNGRPAGDPDIRVAAGQTSVVRLRWLSAPDAGTHAGRVSVTLGVDASLLLLESYEGPSNGTYVAAAELDVDLAEGTRLTRLILADDAAEATSVSDAAVRLAPRAAFAQTVLTSGARRQRIETRVTHPGAGASVRMDGLYVLAHRRHADLTTVVVHDGRDGETHQLAKGVVRDQARAVFQGRIEVLPGADGTDARMGHHALILSERAEVDAKPELEIYADEVSCTHGNTVGSLDEDALFYARSRGVPEDAARAMLTGAFLAEVLDRVEQEDARAVMQAWLELQLSVQHG